MKENNNNNDKVVYVLDIEGELMMPTRRFGKVRRLLKNKLAKVARMDPFTIKLLYKPKTHVVDDLTEVKKALGLS